MRANAREYNEKFQYAVSGGAQPSPPPSGRVWGDPTQPRVTPRVSGAETGCLALGKRC